MSIKSLTIALKPMTAGWQQDPATRQWYFIDEIGNRYVYVSGYLYPMMSYIPAPKVVNVMHGDTLRIFAQFKYSGPAKASVKLFGAIGERRWYDPIWGSFQPYSEASSPAFSLSESLTPVQYNKVVDVPVTSNMWTGKHYSIYAKVVNGLDYIEGQTGSAAIEDAVYLVSHEPTFSDFEIIEYNKV
ncbi:hypothetical protein ACFLXC_04665 [Chloroflexota bacterium]